MFGSKTEIQPDGSSQHHIFEHLKGDDHDMILRNANDSADDSYVLHMVRDGEVSDQHLLLYRGLSASGTPVASSIFSSGAGGMISTTGSSQSFEWQTPRNAMHSDFTIGSRALRWYKQYEVKRKVPLVGRAPGSIDWILTDVTDVPAAEASSLSKVVGTTLATLKLAPWAGKRSQAEVGNLIWLSSEDASLQLAAMMVVMSLWHRGRQAELGEELGPRNEVHIQARTSQRKNLGGLGGGLMAGDSYGAAV